MLDRPFSNQVAMDVLGYLNTPVALFQFSTQLNSMLVINYCVQPLPDDMGLRREVEQVLKLHKHETLFLEKEGTNLLLRNGSYSVVLTKGDRPYSWWADVHKKCRSLLGIGIDHLQQKHVEHIRSLQVS